MHNNGFENKDFVGFSVVSELRVKNSLEGIFETPYFFDGKKVEGRTCIDLLKPRDEMSLSYCEFWCKDNDGNYHNVEDMCCPSNVKIEFSNSETGKSVNYFDARDELSKFSLIVSNCPYVMTYSEYVDSCLYQERRGFEGPPSVDDYSVYLDSVRSDLRNGNVSYVGSIDSLRKFDSSRDDLMMEANYLYQAFEDRQTDYVFDV